MQPKLKIKTAYLQKSEKLNCEIYNTSFIIPKNTKIAYFTNKTIYHLQTKANLQHNFSKTTNYFTAKNAKYIINSTLIFAPNI